MYYKSGRTIMSSRLVLLSVAMVVCAGCSNLVPLTAELRETYDLDSSDLANLQYFTSAPILLDRSDQTDGSDIQRHMIVDGTKEKQQGLWLDTYTPGIPTHVSADGGFIKVRFEHPYAKPDADSLGFANGHTDKYRLAAKSIEDGEPVVTYDEVTYNADARSWQSHLLVDLQEVEQLKKQRRRLGGTYFCRYPRSPIVRPFFWLRNPAPDIAE